MQIKCYVKFYLLPTALCESYMRKLKNFNNKSIYWLKRMYYTTFHHFYFIDMRNDLLIIIQSYSKYDTYGKEKNYKCIAKPRSKQNTDFVYFCKKKLCVHSNFFIYFFFFERESVILILFSFYVCHIYHNFILFFPYLADG